MTDPKYTEDFLRIWKEYPRPVGKLAAFKAFQKLHCQNGDVEAIIYSIREHNCYDPQWNRKGGQYIPHLATFLNQRRFEDEI